jgi:hypothetical protein
MGLNVLKGTKTYPEQQYTWIELVKTRTASIIKIMVLLLFYYDHFEWSFYTIGQEYESEGSILYCSPCSQGLGIVPLPVLICTSSGLPVAGASSTEHSSAAPVHICEYRGDSGQSHYWYLVRYLEYRVPCITSTMNFHVQYLSWNTLLFVNRRVEFPSGKDSSVTLPYT